MKASATRRDRRQGFTLLEVLIALVVMSIGLLGIGKLVMLSARANDGAYLRTQATALAYSILDAMRANRQQALVGGYNDALGVNPGSIACGPCVASQQAQNDLAIWQTSVGTELPAGQGSVATANVADPVTGTINVTATVTVQWNDAVAQQSFGGPAAGNVLSVTLETLL
ncbi:MAG: type IV pilus modification protein PilV [Steroidobacteraceae bacterium]